ncbi:tRNA (5-methylaminomethyl-2-thiouridine)(34)-methyltransferase MnmD [Oxynema aestuarii]|uniref:MnmC-like methyltransferase domain-containing protein n=1 Tax=Oxynema aestuarii AP17 TaxID=2064643 RepID=A0A6H1TT41_9CYAN|nr:MnmC family methyltransferase [Oxynema aestuarii]QIZ69778.1 hypothetical protein HCG48_03605 [Oxynema aestuarii AP17]RMH71969.1 MAG: hypothetical protein D6680_20290 [Cyanobacteria bacterium J007]
MTDGDRFTPQLTADGSFTFFSPEFGESFHSHFGARQEAQSKFVEPTQLALKARSGIVRILDVCYGLGYNSAAAFATIWAVNADCRIEWFGLESDRRVPEGAIAHHLLDPWGSAIVETLSQLARDREIHTDRLDARLLLGDARQTVNTVIGANFQADAIFLDPFSPPQCPQLWTVEFLHLLSRCLHPHGRLATYSCAAAVRAALIAVGLSIGSTPPVGRKAPGTVASFSAIAESPLSPQEREHLQTRAAIPYRDRQLQDPASEIIRRRQLEQQTCQLEPTSRWKKRWMLASTAPDSAPNSPGKLDENLA